MVMRKIAHLIVNYMNEQDMVVFVSIARVIEADRIVKVVNWVIIDYLRAQANVYLADVIQQV